MTSNLPIVRQVSWVSLIPQIIILIALIYIARLFGFKNYEYIGLIFYIIFIYVLRFQIPKDHRRGVKLYKKHNFSEAIPFFQNSYDFFKKHLWIDKFRFITLMFSSKISYTEMALLNMAFCHGQIGNGKKSKEIYEQVLKEFPNSEIAKASLRMFASAEENTEPHAQQ